MQPRMRNLLSALVMALVSLAWVTSALIPLEEAQGTATAAAPPLGGINATDLTVRSSSGRMRQEIAWAAALHAKVIRVEIPWSELEPRGPGQIDPHALAFTDELVGSAAAAGIKVLALTQRTPCWTSSAPPALLAACRPGAISKANAWPPTNPNAYGSFVAFLARRYGAKLAAIEVWNEPDQANEDYFAGPDKPRRYAVVLRAGYTAVKAVDPNMPVLGASMVGSNGAFLKALYAAGIKGYYDGLSVHYYNLVLGSLRSIREVQRANGDAKPLWLNEFGWSSCWPRLRIQAEQGCVTPATQAANLRNLFRSLAHTPWIAAEIAYELRGSRSEDFGVLTEAGARKPSFGALRSVLISPYGTPSPVTVRLTRRNGRILASGGGPVGDYMQLEALRGATPIYRALFTMNRFNRYSVALPKALGTSNLHVIVFQSWAGRSQAARASV